MDLGNLQAYGYFIFIVFLVVGLYAYIYHLYKNRKNADGIDYETYSKLALNDDLDDTPVASMDDEKVPDKGEKRK